MFCNHCGRPMQEGDAFCPACGKAARNIPLMPNQSRLSGHVRLLGIFWIALSAFRILPGLIFAAIVLNWPGPFNNRDFSPGESEMVHGVLMGLAGIFIVVGLAGIVTGIGLLKRAPWARMCAIIFGCIGLVDLPLGTALGIYTLWVMLPAQSEQEYQQMARAA